MSIATGLAPTVKKAITDFGSNGVYKKETIGAYDPATGTNSTITTTTNIKLIPEAYSSEEIKGSILTGDLKLMVVLDAITPSMEDKITFNNIDYSIINIEPIIFQDVVMYIQLQVRA